MLNSNPVGTVRNIQVDKRNDAVSLLLLFTRVTECCSPSPPWGGAATLLSTPSLTDLAPSDTITIALSDC